MDFSIGTPMEIEPPNLTLLRQVSALARENIVSTQEKAQLKEYVIGGYQGSIEQLLHMLREDQHMAAVAAATPPVPHAAAAAARPAALDRQFSPVVITTGLTPWQAVQRMQIGDPAEHCAARRLFLQCNLEVEHARPDARPVLAGLPTAGGWRGMEEVETMAQKCDMIVSSQRGVGYRKVKVLKDALYGSVELRAECVALDRATGAPCAFAAMGTHIWRETGILVALKLMQKANVEQRRTVGSRMASQEDALNEMAGLLYLHHATTCPYISTIIELLDTGTQLIKVEKFAYQGELFDHCAPDSKLFDVPAAGGAPSRPQIITAQILAALRHCHHQGLAHLDLSLENVLLASRPDEPDEILLIDFGMCRSVELFCAEGTTMMPARVFYPTGKREF